MDRYKCLLFDLDGTLIDSAPGIMECFRYTADKLGIRMPEDTGCLLGPPLIFSFEKYFGLDSAAAENAVQVYREHYGKGSLFNIRVYDGVPEMLVGTEAGQIHVFHRDYLAKRVSRAFAE